MAASADVRTLNLDKVIKDTELYNTLTQGKHNDIAEKRDNIYKKSAEVKKKLTTISSKLREIDTVITPYIRKEFKGFLTDIKQKYPYGSNKEFMMIDDCTGKIYSNASPNFDIGHLYHTNFMRKEGFVEKTKFFSDINYVGDLVGKITPKIKEDKKRDIELKSNEINELIDKYNSCDDVPNIKQIDYPYKFQILEDKSKNSLGEILFINLRIKPNGIHKSVMKSEYKPYLLFGEMGDLQEVIQFHNTHIDKYNQTKLFGGNIISESDMKTVSNSISKIIEYYYIMQNELKDLSINRKDIYLLNITNIRLENFILFNIYMLNMRGVEEINIYKYIDFGMITKYKNIFDDCFNKIDVDYISAIRDITYKKYSIHYYFIILKLKGFFNFLYNNSIGMRLLKLFYYDKHDIDDPDSDNIYCYIDVFKCTGTVLDNFILFMYFKPIIDADDFGVPADLLWCSKELDEISKVLQLHPTKDKLFDKCRNLKELYEKIIKNQMF